VPVPRALSARLSVWQDAFDRLGYEPAQMEAEERTSPGGDTRWLLLAHAARSRTYGGVAASIDVREEWQAEAAAQRGLPSVGGWHLQQATYHAQVGGSDPSRAERIDVDPRGGPHPLIHRHPYGRPNDVREPLEGVPPPAQLLNRVEEIVISAYHQSVRRERRSGPSGQ
jgi:hypothetical protein